MPRGNHFETEQRVVGCRRTAIDRPSSGDSLLTIRLASTTPLCRGPLRLVIYFEAFSPCSSPCRRRRLIICIDSLSTDYRLVHIERAEMTQRKAHNIQDQHVRASEVPRCTSSTLPKGARARERKASEPQDVHGYKMSRCTSSTPPKGTRARKGKASEPQDVRSSKVPQSTPSTLRNGKRAGKRKASEPEDFCASNVPRRTPSTLPDSKSEGKREASETEDLRASKIPRPTLPELPSDALAHVFKLLGRKDIGWAREVCRTWRDAVDTHAAEVCWISFRQQVPGYSRRSRMKRVPRRPRYYLVGASGYGMRNARRAPGWP